MPVSKISSATWWFTWTWWVKRLFMCWLTLCELNCYLIECCSCSGNLPTPTHLHLTICSVCVPFLYLSFRIILSASKQNLPPNFKLISLIEILILPGVHPHCLNNLSLETDLDRVCYYFVFWKAGHLLPTHNGLLGHFREQFMYLTYLSGFIIMAHSLHGWIRWFFKQRCFMVIIIDISFTLNLLNSNISLPGEAIELHFD